MIYRISLATVSAYALAASAAMAASFQGLGDLPGGDFSSQARGVSDDGTVVVGIGTTTAGQQAFRWTASAGMASLGNLPNGSYRTSSADGISGDGATVVGYGNPAGPGYDVTKIRAFRWTQASGMVDFSSLAGATINEAGISRDGSVMVGRSGYQAFRWTPGDGLVVGLGTLPERPYSRALGVSAKGTVIVGTAYSTGTDFIAFIWDEARGIRILKQALEADYGLKLTGWNLQSASNITPDGSVIVGFGANPSGQQEAFRVVLDQNPPRLAIRPNGDSIYLSWSTNSAGFELESATALNGSWAPVPGVSACNVTLPVHLETNQLFRLKK